MSVYSAYFQLCDPYPSLIHVGRQNVVVNADKKISINFDSNDHGIR